MSMSASVFKGLNPVRIGARARLSDLQHHSPDELVTNGLGERSPKLPVIWIEGGLAWVPFIMQRLDMNISFVSPNIRS